MVVGGSGYGRGLLWVVSEAGRVAAGITSVRGEACVGWVHDSVRWAWQHLSCVSGKEGCFL